jgi:hypothetical protein
MIVKPSHTIINQYQSRWWRPIDHARVVPSFRPLLAPKSAFVSSVFGSEGRFIDPPNISDEALPRF